MRAARFVPGQARRLAKDAVLTWGDVRAARAANGTVVAIPGGYFIKYGYVEREAPDYDDLTQVGTNWQASVYERAATYNQRVVDVGCGDGRNHRLLGAVPIVGLDYGPNLAAAKRRTPRGVFLEVDLEQDFRLPVDWADAIVVCADVIEHLRRPDALLNMLADALGSGAEVVLLSTPERDLFWGRDHHGPPPNKGHVREWNQSELANLLSAFGFTGTIEVVRSNDVSPERKTILATLTGSRRVRRG